MGGGGFSGGESFDRNSALGRKHIVGLGSGTNSAFNDGHSGDLHASCPLLTFSTPLNSVDPSVISSLQVGDKLDIDAQDGSILAITMDGRFAGSITAIQLAQLSACMDAGYRYVGIVERITGGTCMIRIIHSS